MDDWDFELNWVVFIAPVLAVIFHLLRKIKKKKIFNFLEQFNMIIACILLYRNFPLPLLIIVIIIVSIKWSWDTMMCERKWKALGISNHDNNSDIT